MAEVAKKGGHTKLIVGSLLGIGALAAIIYYFKNKNKAATDNGDGSGKDKSKKGGGIGGLFGGIFGGKGSEKEHHDNVDKAVASAPASATTAAGTAIGTTPTGQSVIAPTTGGTGAGEGSAILYISPRITAGVVTDPNTIEVRTHDALFADGSLVQLTTPKYNGQFTINGTWDAGDGTGSVFINTPYIDDGHKNAAGLPEYDAPGTIAVIGDPSAALPVPTPQPANSDGSDSSDSVESFEGMPGEKSNMEFSSAVGKAPTPAKKVIAKAPKKQKFVKLIPKAEGVKRKSLQVQGKKSGLKGPKLKSFIMANKHK